MPAISKILFPTLRLFGYAPFGEVVSGLHNSTILCKFSLYSKLLSDNYYF